jgi:hypothetical protein
VERGSRGGGTDGGENFFEKFGAVPVTGRNAAKLASFFFKCQFLFFLVSVTLRNAAKLARISKKFSI